MEENRYWGVFGLKEPDDTGAKEQEAAEPAGETLGETGGKEQEITDPAGSPEGEHAETIHQEDGNAETGAAAKQEQTAEERRAQAAQRREQERLELIERIRKEEAEKNASYLKKTFSAIGLKDGNGNPIETMEAFEAYQAERRSERVRKELQSGRLTPEALQEAVSASPEIQQVLQKAQKATEEANQATQQANRARYAANLQQEIALIQKVDPSVKSMDDIVRMETGPEFARLLRTGLTPSEAFRLANFESIRERDKNAAEQAARNAAAGKKHLQSSLAQGKEPLSAPEDWKENVRKLNPNMTDEQLESYYRKYHKSK